MKFKVEMSTEESVGLLNTFTKLAKLASRYHVADLEHRHEIAMLRAKKEQHQKTHTFIVDEGDEESEEESEGMFSYEEPDPTAPAIHFTVHENKVEAAEVKEDEADVALVTAQQDGRVVFEDLVAMWLRNFQEEDATQPPRGDEVKRLSLCKDGQRLLHYILSVGGVTHAVCDVWPQSPDNSRIRYVAENITQVSSILFPEVAELLEYPNPLEE